jgi:hypothetical protein
MPAMIPEWLAALAEAPARLRTRKTAKWRNVREIDLENPDAVRQRRASTNSILGVLKAALNLAFREGHAASDEAWRRVKPFRKLARRKSVISITRRRSGSSTPANPSSVRWCSARF